MKSISMNDTLVFIPARSGSKGVKGKNYKKLNGKPLISFTLDFALRNFKKENIYVSTNCKKIIKILHEYNIDIPEKRPRELSTDDSSIYDSLIYTLNLLEKQKKYYKKLIMLQPTSPLRKDSDLKQIFSLYEDDIDAVISVVKSKTNPYFTLFEENDDCYLEKSKKGNFHRRQDCPDVYEFNGSIFLFNVESLKRGYISSFKKIKKFEMEPNFSIDIDDSLDWELIKILIKKLNLNE